MPLLSGTVGRGAVQIGRLEDLPAGGQSVTAKGNVGGIGCLDQSPRGRWTFVASFGLAAEIAPVTLVSVEEP